MNHAPARINPDTRTALLAAMGATSVLVAVSFVLSFAGLSALAPWAAVPRHLAPLVPLFIDGAILVYTYSALAARARDEPPVRPWTWVALWTLVSSAANAAHAWAMGPSGWQGIVGAVLAGLFPIGSLLGTHEIAHRMIGAPVIEPDADPAPVPAPRWGAIVDELGHAAPPRRRADRAEVVRLRREGMSYSAIATQLGIPRSTAHAMYQAAS